MPARWWGCRRSRCASHAAPAAWFAPVAPEVLAGTRSHRNHSWLPEGPTSDDSTSPRMLSPVAGACSRTRATAVARSAGSRTTPPGTSRGVSSNWGLTIGRMSPPGEVTAAMPRSSRVSEMKDTSATVSETGSGRTRRSAASGSRRRRASAPWTRRGDPCATTPPAVRGPRREHRHAWRHAATGSR